VEELECAYRGSESSFGRVGEERMHGHRFAGDRILIQAGAIQLVSR
jgi:hypothetical protein